MIGLLGEQLASAVSLRLVFDRQMRMSTILAPIMPSSTRR